MMQTGKNFIDRDRERRTVLMQNLSKIILYFKASSNDIPQQIQKLQHYKKLYESSLSSASKIKPVDEYTGETETSDYDDYLYYISKVDTQIRMLQSRLDLLGLLNYVFQIQIQKEEVQEAISWQNSEIYAALNRYDKEDEDDTTGNSKLLQYYEEQLQTAIKKCLSSPYLQKYLDFIIAKTRKQTIINQQKQHYRV